MQASQFCYSVILELANVSTWVFQSMSLLLMVPNDHGERLNRGRRRRMNRHLSGYDDIQYPGRRIEEFLRAEERLIKMGCLESEREILQLGKFGKSSSMSFCCSCAG